MKFNTLFKVLEQPERCWLRNRACVQKRIGPYLYERNSR